MNRRSRRISPPRNRHARRIVSLDSFEKRCMASESLAMLGFGIGDISIVRSIDSFLGGTAAWQRPQVELVEPAGGENRPRITHPTASINSASDWPATATRVAIAGATPAPKVVGADLPRPEWKPLNFSHLAAASPIQSTDRAINSAPDAGSPGGAGGTSHGGGGGTPPGGSAPSDAPPAAANPADPPPLLAASDGSGPAGALAETGGQSTQSGRIAPSAPATPSRPSVGGATPATPSPVLPPTRAATSPSSSGGVTPAAFQADPAAQGSSPPRVQIIDDGDPGYSSSGGWTRLTNQGYEGDVDKAPPGNGDATATWTFPVSPGLYRVSATWPANSDDAVDARYSITEPLGAPPVGDASFEGPALAAGTYQRDPAGSAWAFTRYAGVVTNGSTPLTSGNPDAPQGNQVGYIQDDSSSISQAVAGWAAGSYTISFQAAQRGDNPTPSVEDFEVLVDGASVGTFQPSGADYQACTTSPFTVTAGSHTIEFLGIDSHGGDNSALIDQVGIALATTLGSAVVDQTKAPAGFEDGGVTWQDLGGTYDVTGGSLTVALSGVGDGGVEADAVRIERLTTGPFLQGTVYDDAGRDGHRGASDPPLADATVSLYADSGATLVATATTDDRGGYLFDDYNVPGGLTPGTTYRLTESDAGYSNTGTQALSQLDRVAATTLNSIDVTVADPSTAPPWLLNAGGSNFEDIHFTVYNPRVTTGPNEEAYVGGTSADVDETDAGYTTPGFTTFCVDMNRDIVLGDTGLPYTIEPLDQKLSEAAGTSAANAGRIAYLFNHHGQDSLTAAQAAGLQLAIWDLEYDATPTDLVVGDFQVASGTDPAAIAAARAYLAESVGRDEKAVYLDGLPYSQRPSGSQGLLATGSFDFGNAPVLSSRPASLSGSVYDDLGNDGIGGPKEPGVAGVTVTLSGTDDQGHAVGASAVTRPDGSYAFDGLQPGTYILSEAHPAGSIDGKATAGNLGGTTGIGQIAAIVLNGAHGRGYNFGEDRAPAFAAAAPAEVAVGNTYAYTPDASDPDGDPLRFTLLSGPDGASFDPATGAITWATSTPDIGNHSVSLRVDDGRGGSAERDFTISVLSGVPDRPPIFTSTPIVDAFVGSPYIYQATASDPDFDPLTFGAAAPLLGGMGETSAGLVTWTPAPGDLGPHPVSLSVSDDRGGTATQTYEALVHQAPGNHPPVIVSRPITALTVPVNQASVPYEYPVVAVDPDGDPVTYLPVQSDAQGVTFDQDSGLLRFQAAPGTYHFTVQARDNRGGTSAPQSWTLVVSAVPTGEIDGRVGGADLTVGATDPIFLAGRSDVAIPPLGTINLAFPLTRTSQDGSDPDPNPDDYHVEQPPPCVAATGGESFSFQAEGGVIYARGGPNGPDGGVPGYVDANVNPVGGISGYSGPAGALVGVFLGAGIPMNGPAPATLNFDSGGLGTSFSSLSPGLGQVFFIGDGLTGTGQGTTQRFVAPAGATRLFVGLVDALSFSGAPGDYDDNLGHYQVQIQDDTSGLAGWTVFLNSDGSGHPDASNPSAVTDEYGRYSLTGLAAGTYDVTEVVPAGWQAVAPPTGSYPSVPVAAGQLVAGVDFSDRRLPTADHDPAFSGTAPDSATVGVPYGYDAVATDPDQDPLTFDLPVHPAGMAVDPATGRVGWVPTQDEVGPQVAILRARDDQGGLALYQFTVTVTSPYLPPAFTSIPAPAIAGVHYDSPLAANSPDGGTVTFHLEGTIPSGLQVEGSDLVWDSPVYRAGGYPLRLVADDGHGVDSTLSFTLGVFQNPGVGPLEIQSHFRTTIQLGRTYLYQVQATDDPTDPGHGFPLTYSLANTSSVAGPISITPGGLVSWTPTALGHDTFDVQVSDGLTAPVQQQVDVDVTTQEVNHDPTIVPPTALNATVGRAYTYALRGEDQDNDPLQWGLDAAPAGMAIDPAGGVLTWTPGEDQLGADPVTVRVVDGQGGTATRSFTITARGENLPPAITSPPPPPAVAGSPYAYQVQAEDPEGGPITFLPLTFGPSTPAGMAIDASGRITWADPAGGPYSVTVRVEDDQGAIASRTYALAVRSSLPPSIDSRPGNGAAVGQTYRYVVTTTDPQGNPVALSLGGGPPSDITLDGDVVEWTPAAAATASVTVVATDTVTGAYDAQTFPITAVPDQPPVISAIGPQTAVDGAAFGYDVQAASASGPLTWSLSTPDGSALPAGLAIDPGSGRIGWTPQLAAPALPATYHLQVVATDPYGVSSAPEPFDLRVVAETTAPTVRVEYSSISNSVAIGIKETFTVVAQDAVGVASMTLTVGGVPLALDAHGSASMTFAQASLGLSVVATATNVNGLTGSVTQTLAVTDPTDAADPTATLTSLFDLRTGAPPTPLADQVQVTAPMEVFGTVGDGTGAANPVSYTLTVSPINGGPSTTIATSPSAAIADGDLGTFDPTLLADGAYILRLTATNLGGYSITAERIVNVSGRLKLGNLHLSFTDLTVPVAGIPITITRSYDTLNADKQGDFGHGWTLDEGDFRLQVSQPDGTLADLGVGTPIADNTRIVITRPGQDPEGFTFHAEPIVIGNDFLGLATQYYQPEFFADPGVTDKLTVPYTELLPNGDGTYYGTDADGTSYDPADSIFGGGGDFTLTTRQGLAYVLDASTGQLGSVTDRNGNTLDYESTGIYSSTGRAVTFTRDPVTNDITSITDPRNNTITYGYDPTTGDLKSVTDRSGAVTRFFYNADVPHYLDHVVDPAGRTVAQATYTNGRLSSLADAQGNATTTGYTPGTTPGSAPTEWITPPQVGASPSPSSTITFDEQGNPIGAVDALGNTTSATYGTNADAAFGEPTSQSRVVDGQTLTTTYTYDPRTGDVTSSTDPLNRTTYYTSNRYGQPTTITDPAGDTTSIGYDADGNATSTTSPGGVPTSNTYDTGGNVLTSTTPDGLTKDTYDQFGDVHTSTDARGVETTYAYDADGNQTTSSWTWHDPAGILPDKPMTTTNVYDAEDRLIRTQTPSLTSDPLGGPVTDTVYDADGRVQWVDDPHISGQPADGTETIYDADGRVISTQQFHDVAITILTPTNLPPSSMFSSSDAQPFSVTSTVYDAQGRAIWSDDSHRPDEPTDGTHTQYDADGHVTATMRYADLSIGIGPDGDGGMTSTVSTPPSSNLLSTTGTTYDAGRVQTSTDAANHTTTYQYDADGHQVEVDDSVDGTPRSTTATYDKAGRLATSTDALNHTTSYNYDADGRLIRTTYADGSTSGTTYDHTTGRKTSQTDQDGNTTTYAYDSHGDLTDVYLPPVANSAGTLVTPHYRYAYDTYGNLIVETAPLDQATNTTTTTSVITTYAYDAFGNKASETLPTTPQGTPTETWSYNALNQLASTTDFDGQVIDYAYDDRGRVVTKDEYADAAAEQQGPAYAREVVTYSYDGYDASHRRHDTVAVAVADAAGYDGGGTKVTDSYYDAEGRLVEVHSPQGDVQYAYDPATGRKTEVTTANTDITYAYNELGQLTTVTADRLDGANLSMSQSQVTTYGYDADGNLVRTALPNRTVEVRDYDMLGRLASIATTVSSTGAAVFSATYTRDPDGNITLDRETLNGTSQVFDDTYDADGRLIRQGLNSSSGSPGRIFTYAYDLAGNRVASTDSGAATAQQSLTYTDDADGRLTRVATGQGDSFDGVYSVDYTYDEAGNTRTTTTTSPSGPRQVATDAWDLEGRLVGVTTAVDGATPQAVSYSYDDGGNRVSETVGGQATTYLNDPTDAYDRVLEEYSGRMLAATYVRGLDLLFQDRTAAGGGTGLSYYAVDSLGSTRALTNTSGTVTDTSTYDAYGDLMPGQSSVHTTNEFTYAGQRLDAGTGLYDMGARVYDASAGQFTSRDTYDGTTDDPITQNCYAYANADPVNEIDPSGHDGELIETEVVVQEQFSALGNMTIKLVQTAQNVNSVVEFIKTARSLYNFIASGNIAPLIKSQLDSLCTFRDFVYLARF